MNCHVDVGYYASRAETVTRLALALLVCRNNACVLLLAKKTRSRAILSFLMVYPSTAQDKAV